MGDPSKQPFTRLVPHHPRTHTKEVPYTLIRIYLQNQGRKLRNQEGSSQTGGKRPFPKGLRRLS